MSEERRIDIVGEDGGLKHGESSTPTAHLLEDGQNAGHWVLSVEERAKGFTRPVRESYRHVGRRPTYPTRPLTEEQEARFGGLGYVAYEPYPESERPALGRFWTQADLESGCGGVTTMPLAIAETYAREPAFYGRTFCARCGGYFPVGELGEFVWTDAPGERVGT